MQLGIPARPLIFAPLNASNPLAVLGKCSSAMLGVGPHPMSQQLAQVMFRERSPRRLSYLLPTGKLLVLP